MSHAPAHRPAPPPLTDPLPWAPPEKSSRLPAHSLGLWLWGLPSENRQSYGMS